MMKLLCELCALLESFGLSAPREPMVPHIKCSPRENVVGSGMHKHRCDCGATWKHSNNIEQGTQEQFDHAHACPDCGKRQLWKFGQW
jgi:DNA-directed RNA polymerase subunit RPC12/RpoP